MVTPPRLKSPREVFERVMTAPLDLLLGQLAPAQVVEPERSPPAKEPPTSVLDMPGCVAADKTLMVMGHLRGVAKGWGGSGVLRLDIENLEIAARNAMRMGNREIAEELRGWKKRIPSIRSSEQAEQAIGEFEELAQRAWQMGVKCGEMHRERPSS